MTRHVMRHGASAAVLMTVMTAGGIGAQAPVPAGRWNAVVVANGVEVPFRFDIAEGPDGPSGTFFNGERTIPSTAGTFANGELHLRFDQYGTGLRARYRDGALEGTYARGTRPAYPFRATPFRAEATASPGAPWIGGEWTMATESAKGETAWRFIVRQQGGAVEASILRVDGDTGTLSGVYRDGTFVLSHFSGARPLLVQARPEADGSLALLLNGKTELVALREGSTGSSAYGPPTDPASHTGVKDERARFTFRFPDLDGRTVADTDARFKDKVVLVSITGSWCPNCHDEAPFLADLYRRYRGRGLEIVALSFEEAEQLADPTRLRAFIAQYGIDYTVLLAGEPDELAEKVPQADNLDAFPTTFLLGRDGRVRGVHAGFPSPGSGVYYTQAVEGIRAHVEALLAEAASGSY
jgi:peroxiredoxin